MYGSDSDKGLSRLSRAIALAILLIAVLSLLVGSGCAGATPKAPSATDEVPPAPTQTAAASLKADAEATIAAARSTIEASQATSTPEPMVVSTAIATAATATVPPTAIPPPPPSPEPTTVRFSSWRMQRGNAQRSAWTADVGPASPELLWTFQAESELSAPVIAADGTMYVDGEDGTLHALNPSGVEMWRQAIAGESRSSPVLAVDGTVYIARDNDLHAFNPNGTLRWTFSADQPVHDMVVGRDGSVYVSSQCLQAIAPDGNRRWVTRADACRGLHSLAVAPSGTIYGLSATDLFAFDSSGALLWEQTTARGARMGSTALTIGPQEDINVNGISAAGAHVAVPIAPLTVVGREGYIRSNAFIGDGFDGYSPAPPAIGPDGTVFLITRAVGDSFTTADGMLTADVGPWQLQASSPTAVVFWSSALEGEPCSQPVLGGDGTIYAALCNGQLLAFQPDGNLKWRFNIGASRETGAWGAWKLGVRYGMVLVSAEDRLLAVGGEPPGPSPAPLAQLPGRIAYTSDELGPFYMYSLNPDGSDVRLLGEGLSPDWSPDGSWIAFMHRVLPGSATNWDIFVMHNDGTGRRCLTDDEAAQWYPAWSPDGSRIALSDVGGLYIMDGDGTVGGHVGAVPGQRPSWSPDGSHITFEASESNTANIYVMAADGSEPLRLTDSSNWDAYPAWSPTDDLIAFTSDRDDSIGIYIMNSDGSNVRRLTERLGSCPAWSPDGAFIAYKVAFRTLDDVERSPNVCIVSVEGIEVGCLDLPYSPAFSLAMNPCLSWGPSPDDQPLPAPQALPTPAPTLTLSPVLTPTACTQEPKEGKIAYVGCWPDQNIWLMNSDGSGKEQMITDARAFGELTWSPDGSRIAFVQDCRLPGGPSCYHIVVANADGTDRLDLTPSDSGKGYSPLDDSVDWSPDGSKIVYFSDGGIYSANPDGSNREFLVEGTMPDWSPDGTKIAYVVGASGIYVANADGSNPVRLTEGYQCDPDWSPDGGRIAYTSGEPTHIMDSDGSNKVLLVEDGDNPRWSPDGTRIAFNRGWDGGVYVINTDGSNLKRIADGGWPAWQPTPCVSGLPTSTPTPTAILTPTPVSFVGGRIAFASDREGTAGIYVMNADGSSVMRLADGLDPVSSPDGRRIASRCGSGKWDICVMNADGSEVTNLTSNQANDAYPVWSPDSRRIAFISDRDGNYEIYVMNADGSAMMNLSNDPSDNDVWPTWSPDGRYVAFYSNRRGDNHQRIYVARADGSGLVDMADNPIGTEPAWAPDGLHIAFADPMRSSSWDIYLMAPDGSGVVNLTNHPGYDGFAVWSPDSRRIAFISDREGTAGIYVMNPDGSGVRRLTNAAVSAPGAYDWSPDSQCVAFESCRAGYWRKDCEIYIVNADGSGLANLTNHPASDFAPAWSPVPVAMISPLSLLPLHHPYTHTGFAHASRRRMEQDLRRSR